MLSIASGYAAWLLSNVDAAPASLRTRRALVVPVLERRLVEAGLLMEIGRFEPSGYGQFDADNLNENLFVLASAASFAGLTRLARRLAWREALLPGFLLLPLLAGALLSLDLDWRRALRHCADFGWLAWPAGFAAFCGICANRRLVASATPVACGVVVVLRRFLCLDTTALAERALPDSGWMLAAWGVPPLLIVAVLLRWRNLPRWPLTA